MAERAYADCGRRAHRWFSVDVAAHFLGMHAGTLRRTLERKAVPAADRHVDADVADVDPELGGDDG
jgi:hypothetical protein